MNIICFHDKIAINKRMAGTEMNLNFKHTKYASYIGYVTQAIINNLPPLLFIIFQKQLNISIEQLGFLISFNFGIQIITDFLAAKYVDKIGYRRAVVAAHICSFIGLVGLGVFPHLFENSYLALLCAMGINAIGGGLIEVLISPIVEALPGDEKASAMSLLHSFYCWGHVGVVIISTIFFNIAGMDNWTILPILWSVVPLFNIFFFSKVPIKMLVEEGDEVPFRKIFTVRIFWILFLLMICAGASEQAMSQWASLFAEVGLGVSKNLGDLLGPCSFAILMGISRTIYGIYGSKMNLMKTIAGSSVLCVISYLMAVFSSNPILALVGCALCGFSVGIMWPGVFSLSAKHYPQGGTAMFAILALAGDVGCSTGPGYVGILARFTGSLKGGLGYAIIFPILLILCIFTLHLISRRKVEPNIIKDVM